MTAERPWELGTRVDVGGRWRLGRGRSRCVGRRGHLCESGYMIDSKS